jgi:hypothetical protein
MPQPAMGNIQYQNPNIKVRMVMFNKWQREAHSTI